MDLATRKLHLLQQFINVVNIETIEKLEEFFRKEVEQNTDELPKEVVALLEKSIEDSRTGRTRPHDKVMKS